MLIKGRYELLEEIGAGGMGRVYRGHDRFQDVPVAVKLLQPGVVQRRPEIGRRFLETSRALFRLDHPGLVRVLDVGDGSDGSPPVLVLEWLDGSTLRALLEMEPQETLLERMAEVIAAMAAAHSAGLVHRDLKPDNVMVLPSGRAKVFDFDLAKNTADDGLHLTMTTAGGFGTPYYMAPEQAAAAGQVDARADVYSLGAMLYEILTGAPPPLKGTPKPVRTLAPACSPALASLIDACLAESPDERPTDAGVMAKALEAARPWYVSVPAEPQRKYGTLDFLGAGGAAPTPRGRSESTSRVTPPTPEAPRRVRPRWMAVGGALVVVAAAATAMSLRSFGSSLAEAVPNPHDALAGSNDAGSDTAAASAADTSRCEGTFLGSSGNVQVISLEVDREAGAWRVDAVVGIGSSILEAPGLAAEPAGSQRLQGTMSAGASRWVLECGEAPVWTVFRSDTGQESFRVPLQRREPTVTPAVGESPAGPIPQVRPAGSASVQGGLTADQIRRVFQRHIGQVRSCYEQGLSRNPNLAGRITIVLTITPMGTVSDSSVAEDTVGDSAVASCVAGAVSGWSFPQPDPAGEVSVRFPLLLSTSGN